MTAALPVVFEPLLVEEAVLRAIDGCPREGAFRRERDRLYLRPGGEARERAFRDCHAAWFEQLQLGEPLRAALAEQPVLAERCRRCVVARAPSRRDEGADLLVAADGAEVERTLLVRLDAAAFLEPEALRALLRGEFLHVVDMLDPDFGYRPELPGGEADPMRGRLLRDRYRVLWDVRVAGRLARAGGDAGSLRDAAYRSFAATFPMLEADAEPAFRRFFNDGARTHADLVDFAGAPLGTNRAGRLARGAACPLCRFATYAPEAAPEDLPTDVVERIARDFPAWRPALGLCRQCADLYRARGLSLAAAARLPG